MLIEKLELGGFLSYQEKQVVDLSGITNCLVTGKIHDDVDLSNGSGKSSLFEMIPFNLFGKEAGRSDILDDYINWTSDELFTAVIFWIDGKRWKSVRNKKRGSSATHEVFYDRNNGERQDDWKITDKKIETILGLSAKTYSSTIYLNERESLAFINGTSSERKTIFRELLDIDVYEIASKISSKKSKEYDEKIIINKRLIEDREEKLKDESQIKNDLKSSKESLIDHSKLRDEEMEELDKYLDKKQNICNSIEEQKSKTENINNEIIELSRNFNRLLDDLEEIEKEEGEQRLKYDREKENVDGFRNEIEVEVNVQIEKYTNIIESYDLIETKMSNVKKEKEEKENLIIELEKSLSDIRKKIREEDEKTKEDEKEKATIISEKAQVNKLLNKIEEFGNVCPITEKQCEVINNDYKDDYKSDKLAELAEIKEKENVINIKLTGIYGKINKLKASEDIKNNEMADNRDNISTLSSIYDEFSKKFNNKIHDIQTLNEQKNKFNTLTEKINVFVQKEKDIEKYFKDVKKDREDIQIEINKFDEAIKKKEEEVKKIKEKDCDDYEEQLENINSVIELTKEKMKEYDEVISKRNIEIGIAKDKLEDFEKTRKHIDKLNEENKSHGKYKSAFLHLTKYFGKDGIQKMLMQNAIPMLEKYSNNLMREFNDGSDKIKIKFDLDPKTQSGERKKGGGLEIYVDEGENDLRNLQNYSGGETVRIVFSIIFGLASLLSMRAGKKHEALIIDEKIAKLDKHGIEQFGKIIHSISKEYKQIFVITHIEELKNILQKDEIIINKTTSGSKVEVVHG
ncbi:MAG TPA: SMC family ATPase [Candidatus Paceibacterota bacterium]|nr:SMC family ATPase [Candidatus Paceibacterota bacterium]